MDTDKYLFDIKFANDAIAYRNAGIVPGGVRLHFDYFGGTISTDPARFATSWSTTNGADYTKAAEIRRKKVKDPKSDPNVDWYGFEGTVVRGTDWALALETGIIQYDGRMTLVSDDESPVLVDMILTGTIDIGTGGFRAFQQGRLMSGTVPGTFVARFETAQPAKPWAARHIREQGEQSWKYQRLTRGVFLVDAEFKFSPADGQNTIGLAVTERQAHVAGNGKVAEQGPVKTRRARPSSQRPAARN